MCSPKAAAAALFTVFCPLVSFSSHAALPAFPGAEGFGAYAVGGRLGDVYHVTNTNPSGAGSLANGFANVPTAGRTIVFDVSGYAHISGTLRLAAPKVTIAGQTAPGDGFGLKDGTFLVSSDDVVIRFMRFRDGNSADAINMDSGSHSSIWDHVDAMFSNDENFSTFSSSPDYMTFQWSFNAWGMETHSCGGLWDMTRTTAHHTLWAHNHTRNPKVRAGMLEWINNVTFDWDIGFIMGDSETNANWTSNAIGCYFIGPPGNTHAKAFTSPTVGGNGRPNFTLYLANCLTDIDGDGVLNGIDRGYGIVEGTSYTTGQLPAPVSGDSRYYAPAAPLTGSAFGVVMDSPLVAYKKVVSSAGPVRFDYDPAKPLRDEVAELLITNLVLQRRFHVNAVSKTGLPNGGFGNLVSTSAPIDTDQDGIPDYFESAVTTGTGLSVWNSALDDHILAVPNSGGFVSEPSFFPANTAVGTAAADKYTHLEEYLHFLAIPHGLVARNTVAVASAMDIDLSKFTRGFNTGAVFTLANVVNGTFTQSGAGGKLVHFVPTQNAVGRAKFNFTVTDADGSTWTQQFGIVITTNALPRDLTWKGDGVTNAWNSTSLNWLKAGSATSFVNPDYVTFDDTGSNTPNIALTETVSPSVVNITSSVDYGFTTANGSLISGIATVRKFGVGKLTIATPNTYTGGTTIDGSTLTLGAGGAIGTGALTLQNGAIFTNTSAGVTISGLSIPAGGVATVNSGTGLIIAQGSSITGAGSLVFNVQNAMTIKAAVGTFTGSINFVGAGNVTLTTNGGSFGGFDNSTLDIGGSVSLLPRTNSGGNTYAFASLSGSSASAVLGGGTAGSPTYNVGAFNLSTTFAGAIGGNAIFNKNGTGTLTLTGTSTHTGATAVNVGTLVVNGSFGASAVSVASGATLAGTGSLGGTVSVASGGKLTPGNPGAAGTITLNALTIGTGSSILFDISSNPASGNDKIVLGGGKLTSTGGPTLQFNLIDGQLGAGTYPIFSGGANTSNTPAFSTNLPTGARQTFAFQTPSAGSLNLVVTGAAATLNWLGTTNAWNTNGTVNWSGAPDGNNKFLAFDAVTFDDTAATGAVTISGAVRPRSLTVNNNTLAYTFTGGTIAGGGSLIKNGPGTLFIAPVAIVLSSTTTVGTTVTVDTTSLAAGMNVTGTGISGGTTIASITNATTLVLSRTASAAATVNLNYFGNSYSGGTFINGGTIALANELAEGYGLGTGAVTFNGGTLSMYDDFSTYSSFSTNFIVPAGATGTVNADSRVDVSSSLSGGGTLNYFIPANRTALMGDWSAFTGVVNLTTDADGGDFRFGTSYGYAGFPNAGLNLAAKISMYYIGTINGSGTTITIGEISGAAGSNLSGGATVGRPLTYRIGGRNTDATFAGFISEQGGIAGGNNTSYVKTGSGTWTLSGTALYNGGTTVEQGTLRILGSFTSNGGQLEVASFGALKLEGGGSITVDSVHISANAQFSGFGTITGDFTNDGSTTTTTGGKFTVTGTLTNSGTMTFTNGSSLEILGDMANSGTLALMSGSQLIGSGAIVNTGIVDMMTGLQTLPANFVNNGIVLDSSQVAVQSYVLGNGTFTVSVLGFQGHSYQLQRSSTLAAGSWQNVGSVQAGAGALTGPGILLGLTDPSTSGTSYFYRVAVTP